MKMEVALEGSEALEAPITTEPTEPEQAMDERMADSNNLELNEIKVSDARVQRPSRAAGERDIFTGGESVW